MATVRLRHVYIQEHQSYVSDESEQRFIANSSKCSIRVRFVVVGQARNRGGVLLHCSRLTHAHSLDAAVNASNETHPRLLEVYDVLFVVL